MSPDEMLEHALAGNGDGAIWHDLCGALHKGLPVERIRPLFTSSNPCVIAGVAFIANELGRLMHPFMNELITLADDASAQVRSDVIYALSRCARSSDLNALSRIMLAFDDPDPFVHRAAIMFPVTANDRALSCAVAESARRFPKSPFERILSLLQGGRDRLSPHWEQISTAKLTELINHDEAVVRRFGVGLAARPRLVVDVNFLEIAKGCEDSEGLAMIDHFTRSPKPTNARLARVAYVESRRRTRRRYPS